LSKVLLSVVFAQGESVSFKVTADSAALQYQKFFDLSQLRKTGGWGSCFLAYFCTLRFALLSLRAMMDLAGYEKHTHDPH
jgi:hypothetical protein